MTETDKLNKGSNGIKNDTIINPINMQLIQIANVITGMHNNIEKINLEVQKNMSNIELLHKAFSIMEKNIELIEKKLKDWGV